MAKADADQLAERVFQRGDVTRCSMPAAAVSFIRDHAVDLREREDDPAGAHADTCERWPASWLSSG